MAGDGATRRALRGSRALPGGAQGTASASAARMAARKRRLLRQTQGLGRAVERPNRRRQTGGARRDFVDIVAGDRFGGADQPYDEQADGTAPAGRPFRQIGERAKQRREASQLRPVLAKKHPGLRGLRQVFAVVW
jgi:hypothetical protein